MKTFLLICLCCFMPLLSYGYDNQQPSSQGCKCEDCHCADSCSQMQGCKCEQPCPCMPNKAPQMQHDQQNPKANPPLGACPCKKKPRQCEEENCQEGGGLSSLFSFSGGFYSIADTHFRTEEIEDQQIGYSQTNFLFTVINPLDNCHEYSFNLGYIGTHLDWEENPYFDQKHFGYIDLTLGFTTKRWCDWLWQMIFGASFDTKEFDLENYTLYHAMLWGRYGCWDRGGIHLGFLTETGLSHTKIWPIIGFDYTPCENWKIFLIFPINVSIEYFFNEKISVDVAARFFRSCHRVGQDEPISEGIYEYITTGAEGALNLRPLEWLSGKFFVGFAFPGDLKITDSEYHNGIHNKFDSSIYFGLQIAANF